MIAIRHIQANIRNDEDYFSYPALNQTFLKRYRICPYWAQRVHISKDFPEDASDSIAFGNAVDYYVTDRASFDARYLTVARRSAEMLRNGVNAEGKIELTENETASIKATGDAVTANPVYQELFAGSNMQRIITLAFNEQPFKAKLDFYKEQRDRIVIADLKTCQNAMVRQFKYAIVEYDYLFQMAFYRRMVQSVLRGTRQAKKRIECYLVAADKTPKSAVYRIDDSLLDEKDEEIVALIEAHPWYERPVHACACKSFGKCPFYRQSEPWMIDKDSLLFRD